MAFDNYTQVILLTDRYKDQGVAAGAFGFIIEVWGDGFYEVDFSDKDGITIALLDLNESEIAPVDNTKDKNNP